MVFHHHHHGHDHHGPDHHLHHGHAHEHAPGGGKSARLWRFAVAAVLLAAAVFSASSILVRTGEAIVVTRFGDPVRVLVRPGLSWRLPTPIEDTIPVDLRLRTTSGGLRDVGTRDGLRVLVQAYVAWQVPADPDRVRQFLRAARNQPDNAAEQLRSFIGSSLEITMSSFDFETLVNTDAGKVKLDELEQKLRERLAGQALEIYGITIRQVGIERLTLPTETLSATVERMRAERATVSAQRMAEGQRAAAEIRSNADRDSRATVATARAEAAEIEAKARVESADIYGKAYRGEPNLYVLQRSLDTLDAVINDKTRLILRTDAAPFRALVDGPTARPQGLGVRAP